MQDDLLRKLRTYRRSADNEERRYENHLYGAAERKRRKGRYRAANAVHTLGAGQMRDCRFHAKGMCRNERHCSTYCPYEDPNQRFRCPDYEGKNK